MTPRISAAIAIAAVLSASPAAAQSESTSAGAVPSTIAQAAPGASDSGLTVFIDPVTKQIRTPTPGEMSTLTTPRFPPATHPPLKALKGPGGARGVALDSSYASYSLVKRGIDGDLVQYCVTGEDEAARTIAANPKSFAPVRRREWLEIE